MAIVNQIMTSAMNNPEVLIAGAAAGYLAGMIMTKRKMKRSGMGGMGGMM
jgi:hypothetical protein